MAPLTLFGPPSVAGAPEATPAFASRPGLLLAHLAYEGTWIERGALCALLRGPDDEPASRGSLRLLLTRARRWPWAAGLEVRGSALRWNLESDVGAWRAALERGDWADLAARDPAPLLSGVAADGLPGVQAWLDAERARWAGVWHGAALRHAANLRAAGAHEAALTLLGRVLDHDPLAEDATQRYLEACAALGRRGEGLRAYARFEARLRGDLGLAPLPATQALAGALRGGVRPPGPALVGRAAELSRLREAHTPVVLVTGEAGLGKSRLLAEAWPDARPVRVVEGLAGVPYHPLVEAVRERRGALPDLGPYRAALARFVPDLAAGGADAQDGDSGKAQLIEAFARVFAPEGVLIAEDLHWADPATLEVLTALIARGAPRVVATYRPGEVGAALGAALEAWAGRALTVPLAPLNEAALAELVSGATGLADVPRGEARTLARWLLGRGGGAPLLALAWLRALEAAGAARVGSGGRWESGSLDLARADALPAPGALSALVTRQVGRLTPGEQEVLRLASVLGRAVVPAHLEAVLERPAREVDAALERAEALGLIAGGAFAHDLVRGVLYGSLGDARRRRLHAAVVRALDGVLPELVLAEHALRGGDEGGAAGRWQAVADRDFGQVPGFEDEAVRLYERVRSLSWRGAAYHRATAALAVRRRVAGDVPGARTLIGEVLRDSADPAARAVAHGEAASLAYMDGDLARSGECVRLAVREAEAAGDPELRRSVGLMEAVVAHHRGDYDDALRVADAVVEEQRREAPSHSACNWLSLRGALRCDLGRFEEALADYREQLSLARALRLRAETVKASSDIIATLHDLGRIQEGVPLAEAALDLGPVQDSYPLRYHLALAYGRGERPAEALAHARTVVEGSPSVNMRAHAHALLAELHARAGEAAQAQRALERGVREVLACDIPSARAVVGIAALHYGGQEVQELAGPLTAPLSDESVPAYLRPDLAAARAARGQEG